MVLSITLVGLTKMTHLVDESFNKITRVHVKHITGDHENKGGQQSKCLCVYKDFIFMWGSTAR